jgi:hypothetical protein
VNTGKIDKLLFVVVNARGESSNDFGTRARPPGALDSLLTSIGTPIDATSFQLLGRVDDIIDDRVKPKSMVVVGFDSIADQNCRTHFQGIATAWTLSRAGVNDLIALGRAMVLQSPAYRDFVTALGGTVPALGRSVEQILRVWHLMSRSRGWRRARRVVDNAPAGAYSSFSIRRL